MNQTKFDKKKIVVPLMLKHDFNDAGMIAGESAYYSTKLLEE